MLFDAAGLDLVLVGDSLGMVLQGHDTTVPVTMDDIVYHCKAVARGLHRPFLVADLPFASYPTPDIALANSVRLMQEGGARMVKLESGAEQIRIVEFLARHDIAVCAHLGLKPQSVHKTGGFRVQGREQEAAEHMVADARALQAAGADLLLLECIPSTLGKVITEAVHVPVIGIGAGPATDGQILVLYDMLDITTGRKPRFVRNFLEGAARNNLEAVQALRACGEAARVSRSRALLLTPPPAPRSAHRAWTPSPPSVRFASGCAPGAAPGRAWCSCRPWGICTPGM